ncbi:pseudouridine-5'-phosphatase-like [Trichoplusia ni]|uniref:Pseudouridine-5'-phosphatase-like n=1 Tax=Trichoplusia ni TaxID=7111 RepID=A0A7E5WH93_TRINI|nr:pseudouridine-5'-phosphatase-like [Trichoplusia ni]
MLKKKITKIGKVSSYDVTFFSRTFLEAQYKPYSGFPRGYCAKRYQRVTHCLFDLDGTILNSEVTYHKMLKDVCAKYGKRYTKELEKRNYGSTDSEICRNVVKELQLGISPNQLECEMIELSERTLPKAPLQAGAERLLTHLHDTGIPLALATNSSRRAVRLHAAARPKLFGMFHHWVCATDPGVDRGKPFPDIYLYAASLFPDKPKPAKCLVFEDSTVGLEAASSAGMQVVMTPPRHLAPEYSKKATLIIKTLLEFKPEIFGLPPFTGKPEYPTKKQPKMYY